MFTADALASAPTRIRITFPRLTDRFADSLISGVSSEAWIRSILAREMTTVVHFPRTFDRLRWHSLIRSERSGYLIHPTTRCSARFRYELRRRRSISHVGEAFLLTRPARRQCKLHRNQSLQRYPPGHGPQTADTPSCLLPSDGPCQMEIRHASRPHSTGVRLPHPAHDERSAGIRTNQTAQLQAQCCRRIPL